MKVENLEEDPEEYYEVYDDFYTYEQLVERGARTFYCYEIGLIDQYFIAIKMSPEERTMTKLRGKLCRPVSTFMRGYYRVACHPTHINEYLDMLDMLRENI